MTSKSPLDPSCPSVLSIAGSDSGGGAGLQADLKSFMAMGVHGLTAVAALTAQNTRAVTAVWLPPAEFIREQIRCVLDDFDVRSIKIGMLADVERIDAVAEALQDVDIPIILDPVMIASSGASLLADEAVARLRAALLPRSALLTPNLPEAEVLVGFPIRSPQDFDRAADALREMGAGGVLLKGGHADGEGVVLDRLYAGDGIHVFQQTRLVLSPHGTGCSLSSAIAANLAKGLGLVQAVQVAIDFVHGALVGAYWPGRGQLSVLDHAMAFKAAYTYREPA